jgi:hypothetical protein
MKRSYSLGLIILFALIFIGGPVARTETLRLKIAGTLFANTNGVSKVKATGAFFKSAADEKASLVLDVNAITNITEMITNIVTQVITNGMTNIVENTVTNTFTNVIANALAIDLVDPSGSQLGTLFQFEDVTSVETKLGRQRFFALGEGCGLLGEQCPTNLFLGEISFNDAVMVGTIEFTEDGVLRSLNGVLHTRGDSDEGEFVLDGKVNADNPFVPTP